MKSKGKLGFTVFIVVIVVILLGTTVVTKLGLVENGTTFAKEASEPEKTYKIDSLEDNQIYVWKDFDNKNIEDDANEFLKCPTGNTNIKYKDRSSGLGSFTVWVPSEEDNNIPTLTRKDKLLYVSKSDVPDTFDFLRLYENGYSIGVTSLTADASNHYYIPYVETDENDYKKSINVKSDAKDLGGYLVEKLYLDKVGDMEITEKNVSKGGVVTNLKKNEKYICEFYTGTYYQDYLLTASEHTFTEFEDFTCYGYEFLHSNCLSVDIPDWLCSGYYYINGLGLIRFVDDNDINVYNGKPYDENIAWNNPLIEYDEYGQVIFDPSKPQTDEEEMNAGAEIIVRDIEESEAEPTEPSDSLWSYSIETKQRVFTAEIKLTEIANGAVATVVVTKPDGTVEAFAENDNVITVKINKVEPGAYAFNLRDVAGREFEVTYSTGDTYSGSGDHFSEPEGDEGVAYEDE